MRLTGNQRSPASTPARGERPVELSDILGGRWQSGSDSTNLSGSLICEGTKAPGFTEGAVYRSAQTCFGQFRTVHGEQRHGDCSR